MFRQRWVLQAACGAAAFSASIAVFSLVMENQSVNEEEDEDGDSGSAEGAPLLTHGASDTPNTTIAATSSTVSMASLNTALNGTHLSIVQRARIKSFWDELSATVSVESAIPVSVAVAQMQLYSQRYPQEFPFPQLLHALSVVTHANATTLTSPPSPSPPLPPAAPRRRSTLSLVGNKLFEMAVDTKGGMQDAMHRAVRRYLERALDLFAERLKEAIKDKDMPLYLQANIDVAVDQFLPDIKVELSRKTKDLFVATTNSQPPASTGSGILRPPPDHPQIALVWVAFFYLPYTDRPASPASPRAASSASSTYQDMFGHILHMDRGGYLMKLWGYETITFCITMILALVVNVVVVPTWERQMLMFWIRTLYGLLSFPFLPFKVPVLENVLMHTVRMGYDAQGRTVRMQSAAPPAT
ncbi:hypothetical protein DYB30_008298 [Aphanomyces astaci]|uniref:Uncharacterized protein n=1 Tax=Aphanomyces astaci TaxID=112090 RepID=A0A397CAC6_APHAT|nr:hypothetical protein DYB30_008298 [Aphanomyces astaci]